MKNTPVKILIADDEDLARKRVIKFLNEDPRDFELCEASNGKEALEVINSQEINLLFLDIKMTDMNGFEVLSHLPAKKIPIVIFVTAFDDFAVKAFEVKAIDFLLKPYKRGRFQDALERGLSQLSIKEKSVFNENVRDLINLFGEQYNSPNEPYWNHIVLKEQKKYFFIEVKQVIYIQSSGYYAEIFTKDNHKYLYRISLTDLVNKLNPQDFSRINRSTIVNRNYLKEVVSEGLGDFSVVMKNGGHFNLSKKYKDHFFNITGIK